MRRKITFWLGVIIILVPFLGVPIAWKEYALIVIGVFIAALSLGVQKKSEVRKEADTFVEHYPPAGEKRE